VCIYVLLLPAKIVFHYNTLNTVHHCNHLKLTIMSDKTRKNTETSAFGTPGRVSHDSSKFYNSRLYEGLPEEKDSPYVENPIPQKYMDCLFCKSSESMDELPDCSVHLMVTSPPYNVTKEYDQDLNLDEYLAMLNRVWSETYRVLVPGGRACVNVANLGRKPYIPLHSFIISGMLAAGFLMRGEIIWDKAASASTSIPRILLRVTT